MLQLLPLARLTPHVPTAPLDGAVGTGAAQYVVVLQMTMNTSCSGSKQYRADLARLAAKASPELCHGVLSHCMLTTSHTFIPIYASTWTTSWTSPAPFSPTRICACYTRPAPRPSPLCSRCRPCHHGLPV